MLLLLLFTETITFYHQYQRELQTDTTTGEQYVETTIEDIEVAFALLETILLKKSDELNDACLSFFEKLKAWLRQNDSETFYSKEVRPVFRLSPNSLSRYLYELERMGHIKIARGNRYKGFEYKVQSWDDLETLTNDAHEMMENILAEICKVNHSIPGVSKALMGYITYRKPVRAGSIPTTVTNARHLKNPLYIRLHASFTQ